MALLAVVGLGPAALVLSVLLSELEVSRGKRAQDVSEAHRLQILTSGIVTLVAERDAVDAAFRASGLFVEGESPQAALTALQDRVGRIVAEEGGTVERIATGPVETLEGYTRLPLELTFAADPDRTIPVLARLEAVRPLMLLTEISVARARPAGLLTVDTRTLLETRVRLVAFFSPDQS